MTSRLTISCGLCLCLIAKMAMAQSAPARKPGPAAVASIAASPEKGVAPSPEKEVANPDIERLRPSAGPEADNPRRKVRVILGSPYAASE